MVQLVAFNSYVKCNPAVDTVRNNARAAAVAQLRKEYGISATGVQEVRAAIQALARGQAQRVPREAGGHHGAPVSRPTRWRR